MNPIIKQLAEQAGMNIKTNISGVGLVFGTFEGYKTSHISVEEFEKFADLLIKECCNVVGERNYYVYGGDIGNMILRHFGMEP